MVRQEASGVGVASMQMLMPGFNNNGAFGCQPSQCSFGLLRHMQLACKQYTGIVLTRAPGTHITSIMYLRARLAPAYAHPKKPINAHDYTRGEWEGQGKRESDRERAAGKSQSSCRQPPWEGPARAQISYFRGLFPKKLLDDGSKADILEIQLVLLKTPL